MKVGGGESGIDLARSGAPFPTPRDPIPGPMSVHVEHRPDQRRFTADVGAGDDAVLAYEALPGGTLDLQHTVVPPEARGEGVGDALVRAAVAYARQHHVQLVPTCPYVSAWLKRHPGEADVFAGAVA